MLEMQRRTRKDVILRVMTYEYFNSNTRVTVLTLRRAGPGSRPVLRHPALVPLTSFFQFWDCFSQTAKAIDILSI